MKLLKAVALAFALSVFGASAIFAGSCSVDGKSGELILNGADRSKAVCRVSTKINKGFGIAEIIYKDFICMGAMTVNIICDF